MFSGSTSVSVLIVVQEEKLTVLSNHFRITALIIVGYCLASNITENKQGSRETCTVMESGNNEIKAGSDDAPAPTRRAWTAAKTSNDG